MKSLEIYANMRISLIFSWIIAFSPWLSIYGTFVSGVSIADAAFMCFIIYFVIVIVINKKNIKISCMWLLVFLIYLILSIFLSSFNQDYIYMGNIINRFLKFGLFCFIILFVFPYYLNAKDLHKGIKFLAITSCVAVVLQYIVFYIVGRYLEFKMPFLSYANVIVEGVDYAANQAIAFRPSSIFLEPAHFAVFAILYVAILLFQYERKRFDWIEAICISFCVLLSTSSTALVLLSVLWGVYLLKLFFKWNNILTPIVAISFIALFLLIFIPYFENTPQLYQAFERIMDPNSVAVTGRINAGDSLVHSLSGLERWIGVGFGNLPQYFYVNSINYLLYCSGYIGILFFAFMLIRLFVVCGMLGKMIVVLFLLVSFSSPIVISINIVIYGALIYCSRSKYVKVTK